MNYQQRVYELVKLIPAGEVASYGMIASLLSGVTARMVGYAMAATPDPETIPWWRVVNASGGVSPRPGSDQQYIRLRKEGIEIATGKRLKWADHMWDGPPQSWLDANGVDIEQFLIARPK